MSVLSKAPRPSGDDVRRVALAALAAALDEGTQQQRAPKRKGGLKSGVRTVAAGAALYVAGRAAYNNRDAILEQLQAGREQDDEDPVAEEDEDFEDEDEEPVAEEDEEYEDEDEEPVAEEDEDFEDEDDEPVAEEDDDYDDDIDPVDRPPEPPESDADEEHAEAVSR